MTHPIWWEKTVEYYFVRNHMQNDLIVSPLDGNHERAGDAILSSGLKWLLIEFKKDSTSLKTEIDKFINYQAAKAELKDQDDHHYLIFGHYDDKEIDQNEKFSLRGITYFSQHPAASQKDILNGGTDIETFTRYLNTLSKHKKPLSGKHSGTGGMSIVDYANVLGVNPEGKVVSCSTLQEFSHELSQTLQMQLTHTQGMGGYERGGQEMDM